MDHGDMDHGSGEPMCNMNMLFTWDTSNLCIVFSSWRITGAWSLIYSLVAVIALTAGYEAVREASRRYEESYERRIANTPRKFALPVPVMCDCFYSFLVGFGVV